MADRGRSNRLLQNGASGRDPVLHGLLLMLTCNRLEAGGSKLEAWLTVAGYFELRASSCYPPWLTAGCLFFNSLLICRKPFDNFFYIVFFSNYNDLIVCFQLRVAIRNNHFLASFDGRHQGFFWQ